MDHLYWLGPFFISITYIFATLLTSSHWTWELYDELPWLDDYLFQLKSLPAFINRDLNHYGRFRPLSGFFAFLKFYLSHTDPWLMKVFRSLEVSALYGLAIYTLRKSFHFSWFLIAFFTAVWVKSPPQLEQLRWATLSEVHGIFFLLLSFLIRKNSKTASYIFLILAALVKEPFAVFFALPALLCRNFKEAGWAGLGTLAYFIFLSLARRVFMENGGVPYVFPELLSPTFLEILKGLSKDILFIIPLFLLLKAQKPRSQDYEKPFFLLAFAGLYFLLVLPRATGYNYIFAPVSFCTALALAFFVKEFVNQETKKNALGLFLKTYLIIATLVFPLRLLWNWQNLKATQMQRAGAVAFLQKAPENTVATNCPIDRVGLIFSAKRMGKDLSCLSPAEKCCAQNELFALSLDCPGFPQWFDLLQKNAYNPVFSNERWHIYQCPAQGSFATQRSSN